MRSDIRRTKRLRIAAGLTLAAILIACVLGFRVERQFEYSTAHHRTRYSLYNATLYTTIQTRSEALPPLPNTPRWITHSDFTWQGGVRRYITSPSPFAHGELEALAFAASPHDFYVELTPDELKAAHDNLTELYREHDFPSIELQLAGDAQCASIIAIVNDSEKRVLWSGTGVPRD